MRLLRPTTHLLEIEIRAEKVAGASLDFVMPAWSPGRYAIYDFAKNVQEFRAEGEAGEPLPWEKVDKQTWRVETLQARGVVRVMYRVFANDLSGTFSQFDTSHANLNGASLFLFVAGHERDPITLSVEAPKDWKVISGYSLSPEQKIFQVPDYGRLVDTPMEMSADCRLEQFEESGKTIRVAVHSYGDDDGDLTELVKSLKKIVRSQLASMPEPDLDHYTFIFHFAPHIQMGDGMEHSNSTQIVIRGELSGGDLTETMETASHEFFHLWNVKRLRPASLVRTDYTRELYTRSLWFGEGLTSYYAFLHLMRSGVWTREKFLDRMAREIRTLELEPGRELMSAESSSFHAWFYDRSPQMQQTNFANTTINYYNKGAVLALLLDLEIRVRTDGRKSLDDVMLAMYEKFYGSNPTGGEPERGYKDKDIVDAASAAAGSDLRPFFERYVRGTEPLPYEASLATAGLELRVATSPDAPPTLGILTQPDDRGVRVAAVRPGRAADRGGLSRDDLLIAVDDLSLATEGIRERLSIYPPGAEVPFTVERHGRLQRISVILDPPIPDQYSLELLSEPNPQQRKVRDGWLGSEN
ncbi:MAG: M61 family metallopeptidase [Acidobacteria bacterium]|nr:M61 family metallopeptidase [Acidobacteriota bacterium]